MKTKTYPKVSNLRAGYYEVIGKSGMLAGFIQKMSKMWALSMYSMPVELYESFKDAKDNALGYAKRY